MPPLVTKLRYGRGVCIMEAIRLRVEDLAGPMPPPTVCSGKGDQDRRTPDPASSIPLLQNHLAGVKTWHQQALAPGHGGVYRPYALARKSRQTAQAWGWQSGGPARYLDVDPRAGVTRLPSCGPQRH